jgi:pathogenicity locus Cdd1 protein
MPSKLRRTRRDARKVSPTPKGRQPSDELQRIPGVGPSIARDLRQLGIERIAQLRGRDPERLYQRLIALRGMTQDRCLLYVFRCAVYFASTARPRPERLQWWYWKDAG